MWIHDNFFNFLITLGCVTVLTWFFLNFMYQTVIFFFKVAQNFIVYESAENRNLRAFLTEYKIHYLAIFLPDSIVTGMPYLPAKDDFVSFNRLSSRGLWKWYNSKGFGPATTWRGAAFHFLAVFSKMKILWKLWLWFSKMFHQRVFPDWKWSISKFQFLRQIRRRANSIPWCIFPEASRNIEIRSFSRRLFSHFCSSKSKKIALFCYLTWFLRFAMA